MKNGFIIKGEDFEILGAASISIGQGVEVKQRYAYDYSRHPQSIAYRRRRTARTGNLTVVLNRSIVSNLFVEKDRYEALCGNTGDLYWNDDYIGQFLIKSIQFSLSVDQQDIISALQIGIEMNEAYTPKKVEVPTNIKLL